MIVTKKAISRIAKEGRKYGVSLCMITQRPAELDPTILSQCNTIFSMRLTNERDQEILRAGISDAAASLLEFMPTMGTGDAITFIIEEVIAMKGKIKIDGLQEALDAFIDSQVLIPGKWQPVQPEQLKPHTLKSRLLAKIQANLEEYKESI